MPPLTRCLSFLALAAAIAITISGSNSPAAGVAAQGRERIIVRKDDFKPPVKFKAVRARGEPVKTGEKFLGGDDWLEGLTASIVNETDKPILHVRVEVHFLRPEGQPHMPPYVYVHYLDYGIDPLLFKPEQEYKANVPPVPPSGEIDIILSAENYSDIKTTLTELGYPSGLEGIEMRISGLVFNDGTAWLSGDYYERDRAAPHGWKRV